MSELEKELGSILGASAGGGGGGMLGSLLGSLTGKSKGGGGAAALTTLAPLVGSMLAGGGLQKIVSGLESQGAGDAAKSWVATGANQPVSGAQVKNAVGADQLAQVASKLGVSHDQAAEVLAKVIPHVVDKASPSGESPTEDALQAVLKKLGG